MIIDCEVYLAPEQRDGLEGLIALEDEAGIDMAVLMPEPTLRPANAWLRDQAAGHPRFILCASINPQVGTEEVEEFKTAVRDWGFRGLKLMPPKHGYRIIEKKVYPLMEAAAELDVPVSIHSGQQFCHPLEIAALAADFPTVPVVMDHMGYRYYVREAIIAAERTPNIYLATTAVMEAGMIASAIKAVGPHRVLFGSNGPSVIPVIQLEVVRRTGLDAEAEALVLGGNAAALYRVPFSAPVT
ncbi:MAG TPA: hypothetical protein DEP84_01275 [Chloroflexi bacterium]|nr:hypothetical protein [Chloroflexota bacterium]